MRMLRNTVMTVVLAAACGAAQSSLLINGSFEDPDIPQGTFALFSSIPGWTRTSGPSIEIQDRIIGNSLLPALDGFQQLELDSTGNTAIAQTVTTDAGHHYTLSFGYAARPGVAAGSNGIEVLFNGSVIDSITGSGVGLTSLIWQVHTYTLVATGSTSTIGFRAIGTSDSLGGLIDRVGLVPEPSTALLFGIAAAGFAARRRARPTTA